MYISFNVSEVTNAKYYKLIQYTMNATSIPPEACTQYYEDSIMSDMAVISKNLTDACMRVYGALTEYTVTFVNGTLNVTLNADKVNFTHFC